MAARFLSSTLRRQLVACEKSTVQALVRDRVGILNTDQIILRQTFSSLSIRFLSSSSGGGSGGGKDDNVDSDKDKSPSASGSNSDSTTEDPFGVNYQDGEELGGLGPPSERPPKYVRDPATGKFTGETVQELSEKDRAFLKMNPVERDELLADRLLKAWSADNVDDKDETACGSKKADQLARSIREERMALNTIGRDVKDLSEKAIDDDGDPAYRDPDGFSQPLTEREYKTFKRYMKREHGTDVEDGLVPVQSTVDSGAPSHEENPDLDLTWMTLAARREVNPDLEDPFLDLLPSDLNPARWVNRRKAKKLPKQLLSHNNLELLRRYSTPGGLIMNRAQSRLGAKDQRKIAKLIKRARYLGLIPSYGQWKVEDHGDIRAKDIDEDRPWEEELVRKGYIKRRRKPMSNREDATE